MTLVELLVALAVLSLVSGIGFFVFELGAKSFQTLVVQQGLEAQLRRIAAALRRDLLVTNSLGISSNTSRSAIFEGQSFPRHALCFPGVSDWKGPQAYEPSSGLPNWDRYLLYYANTQPTGRLFRCQIDPPGGAFAAAPLAAFATSPSLYLLDNPKLVPDCESVTSLTQELLEFAVQASAGNARVGLHVKLLDDKAPQAGGAGRKQYLQEIQLELTALNTFPQL